MKKLSKVLLTIFSIGILLSLFAGALAFLGFIIALIIGGDTAATICNFIKAEYFPIVIRVCSVAAGIGLVGMYLSKAKALTLKQEK